jgi:hypothetical protein
MRTRGIDDKNVPRTGTNPSTNTIRARESINGNHVPYTNPIIKSPIVVKTALVNAIIDCALRISQKLLSPLSKIRSYSS